MKVFFQVWENYREPYSLKPNNIKTAPFFCQIEQGPFAAM